MPDLSPPEHMCPAQAERQLAGAVLRDPDLAIDAALKHIDGPEDFYFHPHRLVFEVCRDLYLNNRAGGPLDVHQELIRRGLAADLGDQPGLWLADLFSDIPTGANAEYHAKLVRDASLRRKLWHEARVIVRDCESPPTGTADEALSQASGRLQDLLDAAAGRSSSVVRLDDLLHQTLHEVDARHANPGVRPGLPSGFERLDAVLGGFRPGQLVVFGARPGVGKTAMLLALLTAIAKAQAPTFLASLEMPRLEIGERLVAMGADVRLKRIQLGRLDERDVERLSRVTGPAGYGGCEVWIDDSSCVTAARFGATVRTLVRRRGVKLAALDYLQLLQPADRRESRVLQVGRDSRELKLLARQCNIPVIAPCQLNRESEKRPGGVPRLADLRESGEIEQHADAVVMLHVPPGQDDGAEVLNVEAHVEKNRNGPKGKVCLAYRKAVVRFENAAEGF
jgi:replicative DNA helicase